MRLDQFYPRSESFQVFILNVRLTRSDFHVGVHRFSPGMFHDLVVAIVLVAMFIFGFTIVLLVLIWIFK